MNVKKHFRTIVFIKEIVKIKLNVKNYKTTD